MKVAINGWFMRFPNTGIGQYLVHLLQGIDALGDDNEYLLFTDDEAEDLPLSDKFTKKVITHPIPFLHKDIKKTVWEQIVFPRELKKHKVDLLHIPHFAPFFNPVCKTVVTVLDIAPLVFPLSKLGKIGLYDRYYSKIVAPFLKKTDCVITISEYSKSEIIKYLHVESDKIQITNLAAGEEFKVIDDRDSVSNFLAKYDIEPGYIFYLGDGGYRKNVMSLVKAYCSLGDEIKKKHNLVIAGNAANSIEVRKYAEKEGGAIKLIGFVSDGRRFFYNGAFLFVFPTIYEGFGIPPLEAMLCGVPVVSSIYSSIPEVVGDAGILVAADDETAVKKAIEQVIGDDSLRKSMIEKGFEQAMKFSYKRCAEETIKIYNKL
ncbi:glycosyltransferase family 4 protein [candidate division KSB1 bacterium]